MRRQRRSVRYQPVRSLGRGGMGEVRLVRNLSASGPRFLAVKVIAPEHAEDRHTREAFLREAVVLSNLNHPNVVRWYGTAVDEGSGAIRIFMEYVPDGSLARRLEQLPGGRMAPRRAARVVAALANAVQHVHDAGVFHRDLKPANVLMDGDTPKLSDFGVAGLIPEGALAARRRDPRTVTGVVRGTPGYMPPEQVRGDAVLTAAADVYGLGAILFHLLTGRRPFEELTDFQAYQAALTRDLDPGRFVGGLPYDLAVICRHCLKRPPTHRYQSAATLAFDLEKFLGDEPIRARDYSPAERVCRWAKRRRVYVGLASLVLAAGGIALASRREAGALRDDLTQRREADAAVARQDRFERRLTRAQALWEHSPGQALQELETDADCPPGLRDDRWRALHRLCTRVGGLDGRPTPTLLGSPHYGLAASADGRYLVRASPRPGPGGLPTRVQVSLTDVESGTALWQWPAEALRWVAAGNAPVMPECLRHFAFSPDGDRLVSLEPNGDTNSVLVVADSATGERGPPIPLAGVKADTVIRIAWLPGDRIVYAHHGAYPSLPDAPLRIVGVSTDGVERFRKTHLGTRILALGFSKSGDRVATAEIRADPAERGRYVWWVAVRDTRSGEVNFQNPLAHPAESMGVVLREKVTVALSDDGRRVSWSLWDPRSGRPADVRDLGINYEVD